MAVYKQDIVDINLETGNIHRSFLQHSIGQKDDDADRFGIRAYRNGVPVDLSGCSCHAWFLNSQGTTLALTSYGTVDGNEAYVTLPQACYDYNGQFCLAIKLVGGGISSTVRIVDGMVDNIDVGGAVSPTSEIPDYSDILAQYDAMVAATSAANTAIAETFDATKAYPAGKYVINSGALYRLTADHAANVTWANTSKVAAKFGDDLSDLKSALSDELDRVLLGDVMLHQGALDATNGAPVPTNQTRVYTSPFVYGESLEVNSGYVIKFAFSYNEEGFVTYSQPEATSWTPAADIGRYYRLVISKSDASDSISPSDNIIKTLKLLKTFDEVEKKLNNKAEKVDTDNKIADAKASIIGNYVNLYQGTLDTTYGEPSENNARVYTMPLPFGFTVSVKSGFIIAFSYVYNSNGLISYATINKTSFTPSTFISDDTYYRLVIKKTNEGNLSPNDDIIDSCVLQYARGHIQSLVLLQNNIDNVSGYTIEVKGFRVMGSSYKKDDNSESYLISVVPGEKISFKAGENTSYFLMVDSYSDSQTTPDYSTGYETYGVQVTNSVEATVPTGAEYLIVLKNVGGSSDRSPDAININGYNVLQGILPNFGSVNDRLNTIEQEIESGITEKHLIADNSGYADGALKWLAIGDSYTEINDTDNPTIRAFIEKGYMDRVCEALPQLECTNIGHSGLTFINWGNILNEITSGYDLYTIMLGTNDWSQDADWGTIADFTNRTSGKSLGVLGKLIDRVHSVAPNAKLVVMTQFHRTVGIVPGSTTIAARNHDTYLPNASGLYFADMEKDIIDCCKLENIEYVDIFTESHVTPRNAMKFAKVNVNGTMTYLRYPDYLQYIVYDQTITNPYDSTTYWVEYDGVHPSKVGMQIIADLLADKLRSYLFE